MFCELLEIEHIECFYFVFCLPYTIIQDIGISFFSPHLVSTKFVLLILNFLVIVSIEIMIALENVNIFRVAGLISYVSDKGATGRKLIEITWCSPEENVWTQDIFNVDFGKVLISRFIAGVYMSSMWTFVLHGLRHLHSRLPPQLSRMYSFPTGEGLGILLFAM